MNQVQIQEVDTLFPQNFEWNLTEQAFLQSIKEVARETNATIISFHQKSEQITPAILEECVILQETKLKLLSAFVDRCLSSLQNHTHSPRERSCYLLSNLFNMVSTLWLSHRCSDDTLSLVWQIFVDTVQPFLKIIREFLMLGQLRDPFQEFFIRKVHSNDQFCISDLSEVPNFLQEICQIILLGGASQGIMRSLQTTGFHTKTAVSLDLSLFDLQQHFFHQQLATVTFEAIVSDSLLQPMQVFSLDVERRLVERFISEQKLMLFMECLRDFYFMKSGKYVDWDAFIGNFFNQLDERNREFIDESVIESLLHDAVKTKMLTFNVSCGGAREYSDVKLLESIKFSFEIHEILSYILTEQDVSDYNSILIFLFQIARTKHILDHLHFYAHNTQISFHKLFLLRAKLSHFVNNLQSYVIHRVAKTAWKNLKQNIRKQTSLNSLRNLHKSFLLTVKENCLLTEKSTTILHAIIGILNISVKLSHQFTATETKTTANNIEIVELDSQFQGSMTLLLAIISKILAQKKISSLEDLALRLDFNGFYATNRFQS